MLPLFFVDDMAKGAVGRPFVSAVDPSINSSMKVM